MTWRWICWPSAPKPADCPIAASEPVEISCHRIFMGSLRPAKLLRARGTQRSDEPAVMPAGQSLKRGAPSARPQAPYTAFCGAGEDWPAYPRNRLGHHEFPSCKSLYQRAGLS